MTRNSASERRSIEKTVRNRASGAAVFIGNDRAVSRSVERGGVGVGVGERIGSRDVQSSASAGPTCVKGSQRCGSSAPRSSRTRLSM